MSVVGSRQTRRRRRARRTRTRLRVLATSTLRNIPARVWRLLTRGGARDALLFVALWGSCTGALASTVMGSGTQAILFCLLTVLLCAVIWLGKKP